MSPTSGKLLFWAPRMLTIIFIAFLDIFALWLLADRSRTSNAFLTILGANRRAYSSLAS
jgi:hypothetical protein